MYYRVIEVGKNIQKQELILNGPIVEVIKFAKQFNIFQNSDNKMYQKWCNLIKQRLDKEGLDYETVRPE